MDTGQERPFLQAEGPLKHHIHTVLTTRERIIRPAADLVPSAVLVPLCWRDGEAHILFTQRSMTVEHHKGEISFPGGHMEPDDDGPEFTALRETHEEVGLPPEKVEVLGLLDDHFTLFGYHIIPVVGFIPYPFEFRINSESESMFCIPLTLALSESSWMEEQRTFGDREITIYYLHTPGGVIWGATGRILKQFADLVCGHQLSTAPLQPQTKAWIEALTLRQQDAFSSRR